MAPDSTKFQFDNEIAENIAVYHTEPARQACLSEFPEAMVPPLKQLLISEGIDKLYSHQNEAFQKVSSGHNIVISTGVASGKSLCYQLPVLQALLEKPEARALFLFPTKALAQDQKEHFTTMTSRLTQIAPNTKPITLGMYDGDTPNKQRKVIRKKARLVFSNPDMLHMGILPHHTAWAELFRNITYIIIDEVHIYRGIFGSHFTNLIRRFKRIAAHYGAQPRLILTSATIANVTEFIPALIEADACFITEDGSPRGEKHFCIYNPPLVSPELGIRRSALLEAVRVAKKLRYITRQTLIFAPSRKMVELIVTYLQQGISTPSQIQGYRGGYLAKSRRKIEQQFRSGEINILSATNAMELGVDIGELDTVIITGYPGSIASTRQQSGRSGRKGKRSLTVLIASSSLIDQYLVKNPHFLFQKSPEEARINPDNPLILIRHLECALFEKPITSGEPFGALPAETVGQYLNILKKQGKVFTSNETWYWKSTTYPADGISLRTAGSSEYVLQSAGKTIGIVDAESAFWMAHPEAIYLHNGESFFVQTLDQEKRVANMVPFKSDYYTQARSRTEFEILQIYKEDTVRGGRKYCGQVKIRNQVIGFKKLRWFSGEILGYGDLDLPPSEMISKAYWFQLSEETVNALKDQGNWNNFENYYGPKWARLTHKIRTRDGFICQNCKAPERKEAFHVHHKQPFKTFTSKEEANKPENLITLCPVCHQKAEKNVKIQSGLGGLLYLLQNIAPLFLMCDHNDIGAHLESDSGDKTSQSAIVLYDTVPGGIGLAEKLYHIHERLLNEAQRIIGSCSCADGCPACVGPVAEDGEGAKELVKSILPKIAL